MADQKDRYLEIFLEEAGDQLDLLNRSLLDLERSGPQREIIDEIFRSAHTLKSAAAFIGYDHLSELNHRLEDLFQRIRDQKIAISTPIVDLMFEALDHMRAFLAAVSRGESPENDFAELRERLQQTLQEATGAPVVGGQIASLTSLNPGANAGPANAPAAAAGLDFLSLDEADEEALVQQAAGRHVFDGIVRIDRDAAIKNMRYLLLLESIKREATLFRSEPAAEMLETDQEVDHLAFVVHGDITRDRLVKLCQIDMVEELRIAERGPGAAIGRREGGDALHAEARLQSRNIKVSAEKIDYLMNNVGELVIINSGLQKIYEDMQSSLGESGLLAELKSKIDQAERIARDLQSGIMKTRMIPVGLVFHRFTRPVRDLSHELGKEVELYFHGEDVELDKNIIDALGEPLLHLLRNALDHGIETQAERVSRGKPATARLTLNAYQSGNNIFIEISDDGRGLNTEAIRRKAQAGGLIPSNSDLSADQIHQLIFEPGFSTAATVTDLSGRGVGMNVVKKMTEDFKGSIQIQSQAGQGAAFLLSFPLTLAIVSAILVRIEEEEYAFPLADVVETIRVNRDEVTSLQGRDIINLRGDILPVYRLSRLLGLHDGAEGADFPVLIALHANRKIGFVVDGLIGKKEIVIKSLEQNYRSVPGLIGACLMGDGRIVMVLDVQGLLEIAAQQSGAHAALQMAQSESGEYLNPAQLYNLRVEELQRLQRQMAEDWETGEVEELAAVGASSAVAAMAPAGAARASVNAGPPPELNAATPGGSLLAGPEASASKRPSSSLFEQDMQAAAEELARTHFPEVEPAAVEASMPGGEQQPPAPALPASSSPDRHADRAAPLRELSDEDYQKLYGLINRGMLNAGQVLSQLLGVRVDVSTPEIKTMDYADISRYTPAGSLLAATVEAEQGIDAIVLLVFDEATGYRAAGDLLGIPPEQWTREAIGAEDLRSVIQELINIVGASILNELSNRTGITMTPTVPDFFQGARDGLIRWLDQKEGDARGLKVLYITADFYRQDLEFLGRLFLIPSAQSLARVVNRL
ncbi:MAG: chemotaxis protein CheW [Leptospirales bacterium]|nr:chemotaxis protein CheW [Leptospirales bacterium]